jgi:hypothetical protein
MIYISFQLTMPNVGSWNGKWTGAEKQYYAIQRFSKKNNRPFALLENNKSKSWYYNFGDGWGANVKMEIVDRVEAKRREKISSGFCGYEWMIESILKFNKIQTEGV